MEIFVADTDQILFLANVLITGAATQRNCRLPTPTTLGLLSSLKEIVAGGRFPDARKAVARWLRRPPRQPRDCSRPLGSASYRTRVRSPTPDPAPMCARPARGNIVGMNEVRELTRQLRRNVFVRSPRRSGLTRVLTSMGATVLAEPGHGLSVTGMDACTIASAAAAHYIPIQELTPRSASPEASYLEISQTR
ncbi:MAG: hypothetical protein DLM61_14365 [Pseudonocardiales bacterium]|nr:MAG: hypothetical protein DLM61_14365 [Pseudonocardiales bacterium]